MTELYEEILICYVKTHFSIQICNTKMSYYCCTATPNLAKHRRAAVVDVPSLSQTAVAYIFFCDQHKNTRVLTQFSDPCDVLLLHENFLYWKIQVFPVNYICYTKGSSCCICDHMHQHFEDLIPCNSLLYLLKTNCKEM